MNRPTDNYILKNLPDNEYELISPSLQEVSMRVGDIINCPDELIPFVYFPNNAMISVVASTPDGQLSEAGVVGREGLMGIGVVLGADTTPHENTVQLPGTALKMPTKIVREKFEQCPTFRRLLLRFTHAHMMQISQTALCNRLHKVEQRMVRWILLSHDRSDSNILPFTQELLAIMLGVHRPTVSAVAAKLKDDGYINYRRGKITVLDRKRLEEFSCDCYAVVNEEYRRMMIH